MKKSLRIVVVCGLLTFVVCPFSIAQTFLPNIGSMPDLNQPDALIVSGGGTLPLASWPNYCAPVSAANRTVERFLASTKSAFRMGYQLVNGDYPGAGDASPGDACSHEHERHRGRTVARHTDR